MRPPDRPDRPAHRPVAGLCLLALVATAHLTMLQQAPHRPTPPAAVAAPSAAVRVLATRSMAAAAPSPQPSPKPSPTSARATRAPAVASPRTRALHASVSATPAAAPPSSQPAVRLQARLPPSAELDYRWQQRDQTAPARLSWQLADTHYVLQLITAPHASPRTASWWRSHGTVHPDGLAPARHTARQAPASERALTFIRLDEQVRVAFSSQTYTRTAPADVQDTISWLPHWLARLAASQAEQPIEVADVEGRLHPWRFIPDAADPWHWHTVPKPEQTAVELWLSPEAPHWPVRMTVTPPWGAAWTVWRQAPQTGAPDE